MTQEIKNLDALINRISFDLVNEKILDENQINKMLGILTNDGVYAWWVYSKKELEWKFTNNVDIFRRYNLIKLLLILEKLNFLFNKKIIEDKISEICKKQSDIDKLNSKKEKSEKEKNEIKKLKSEQNELLNSFFHYLSEDLSLLLFFREVLEKILIYARYHAKAMGN